MTGPWYHPGASLGRAGRAARRHAAQLLGLLGVILGLLSWELAVRLGGLHAVSLPPPSAVVQRLPALLAGGPLVQDLLTSVMAVLTGVALSVAVGILLAVTAHLAPWFRWLIAPLVELVRGIAPLALLPAFLLLFGLGLQSTVAIIVWVAWTPIFINVLEGLASTDRDLVDAARSMGASSRRILLTVYAPSLAGHFLAGLRLSFGNAWLAVVAAEMLGANGGVGFRILEWSQTFRITDMYCAIVVIGAASLGFNALLLMTSARWRPARSA